MDRIVLGQNNSTAKKQFQINPNLQRTQATGNRQGFTLGSRVFDYPTLQSDQVVLPNRAVPQNFKFSPLIKVPANVINRLQVPTESSKGNFETTKGSAK